jgi:hypothetical protein
MSGDFRIHFNGEITDAISHAADQSVVVTALEKLSSVGKVAMLGHSANRFVSKKALEGRVSIASTISLVDSYPNGYNGDDDYKKLIKLPSGAVAADTSLGADAILTDNLYIVIEGVKYQIKSKNWSGCGADCIELYTDFVGTEVTDSNVNVPVYSFSAIKAYTTADLSNSISISDTVYSAKTLSQSRPEHLPSLL